MFRRLFSRLPTAEEWGTFLFRTPRRVLATLIGGIVAASALIPGLGEFIGDNLAELFQPIMGILWALMVVGVCLFGLRVMIFGWPKRRHTGGGGRPHP